MKVLIVGSGGREHAIAWKVAQSPKVDKIYCAPGNAGIAEYAECVDIAAMEFDKLVAFAKEKEIDLTVIGMDDPLVGGVVDVFEAEGLRVFGPRKNAAILEGSKAFSKDLMKKYHIPTAAYETFSDPEAAEKYLETAKFPIVLKADGLALGKGVLICNTLEEAKEGVKTIMLDKKFGSAGNEMVIEEFMTGREVSVLSFVDGKTIKTMSSAQDHKRAGDGDTGLNTGGMGNFSPSPFYTEEVDKFCKKYIYQPTVDAMAAEGRPFKGVIFFGLMLTPDGPKVLEYNARFGDPEAQVVLPRMKTDIIDVFEACMPIEEMAARGEDTMRFGPLKPVGLIDPRNGKEAYAVVQLRQDNAAASLYNLVGFQTHLKWPEQRRVFGMIPGLENAEFVRFGVMHKNTYLNSPQLLDKHFNLRNNKRFYFAGQMTGVEGYVESAASGLMAGLAAARAVLELPEVELPEVTAHGALANYISNPAIENFQPMNINFGLIPPLTVRIRKKREKNAQIAARALEALDGFLPALKTEQA